MVNYAENCNTGSIEVGDKTSQTQNVRLQFFIFLDVRVPSKIFEWDHELDIIVQTKVARLGVIFSFNWTEEERWDFSGFSPESPMSQESPQSLQTGMP